MLLDSSLAHGLQGTSSLDEPAWIVFYNQYYGPERVIKVFIDPFPWRDFPPHSPWEHCVVLAWNSNAERIASKAGFPSVPAYVKFSIRRSVDKHIGSQ